MSCSAVFSTATHPLGGGGGDHNLKKDYLFITCFSAYRSFLSNEIFLQEKNGNILVGGYPPPLIGKRPIYFRFFLMKASLMA